MMKFSDKEIVEMLQSSDKKKENIALTFLYQSIYKTVTQYILKTKGNLEDAEDVLQEGLMIFFKAARTHKLPDKLDTQAYLFTICKNKWFRKLRNKKEAVELSESIAAIPVQDAQIKLTLEDEKAYLLNILRQRIGAACYRLLVYFYYEGRKMKEIAQLLSLSNEQVAKNKKAKCMKKLKALIKEEPEFKKAFQ